MTAGRLLLGAIAPPACVACGADPGRAEPICAPCRAGLRWLDPAPVLSAGVELWAPLGYDGAARAMVAALKFRGAGRLAAPMAAQIAAGAPREWLGVPPDPGGRVFRVPAVLVPVPLHLARRRRRGFNQAELLASELAARTGLGLSDCLERLGRGTTQVGRTRGQRARAIEGGVAIRLEALLPAHALLVDDVVTTGATLAACAAALRPAGVREVRALAYARTPGR
jgi:ComF family protein